MVKDNGWFRFPTQCPSTYLCPQRQRLRWPEVDDAFDRDIFSSQRTEVHPLSQQLAIRHDFDRTIREIAHCHYADLLVGFSVNMNSRHAALAKCSRDVPTVLS